MNTEKATVKIWFKTADDRESGAGWSMSVLMLAMLIALFAARPVSAVDAIPAAAEQSGAVPCSPLLDIDKRYLASEESVRLCEAFANRVVLIVNTASKCAYTPQYDGLEKLHAQYADRGLVVIGFPSNDFGGQEPGTEKKIQEFCRLTYAVEFPMFEKTHARRDVAGPLYRGLGEAAGDWPRWNFHKYLLGRDGRLIGSFPSQVTPDDPRLLGAIIEAL